MAAICVASIDKGLFSSPVQRNLLGGVCITECTYKKTENTEIDAENNAGRKAPQRGFKTEISNPHKSPAAHYNTDWAHDRLKTPFHPRDQS